MRALRSRKWRQQSREQQTPDLEEVTGQEFWQDELIIATAQTRPVGRAMVARIQLVRN